jgi:hypothetical protein
MAEDLPTFIADIAPFAAMADIAVLLVFSVAGEEDGSLASGCIGVCGSVIDAPHADLLGVLAMRQLLTGSSPTEFGFNRHR